MIHSEINFESLTEAYFSLIHNWFNQPHVQAFYSLRSWTIEEVRQKLLPYIHSTSPIKGYIIYFKESPIGYIQNYPVKDYPWENQKISNEIVQEAAGLDLFIGEEDFLSRGLGYQIIGAFLEKHIWPYYRYCLVDPDSRNETSIRLFQKCGFRKKQQISCRDALRRPVTLQLFIKKRDSRL